MMRRTISLTALLATALLALGTLATAHAASTNQIIDDCSRSETGLLRGNYTVGDLRRALKGIRGEIAEYTNCYDSIRSALASAARSRSRNGTEGDGGNGGNGSGTDGGGSGGGGVNGGGSDDGGANGATGSGDSGGGTSGGGSTGSGNPEDEVVVAGGAPQVQASGTPQAGSNAPVRLAGATIRPGAISSLGSDANELPSALVVLLVVLGAAALGVVGTTIGRRVLARRRA